MIAVRNIGDSPTTVTAAVPYSKQNGDTGAITLPQVSLAPGAIKLLDTSNPQLRRNDFATAGLEIKYTGAPGSVIASALSVSRSGNHVFGLPLKDPRGGLSSTGGYPWFIDEKGSTVVFIKNSTEAPQQFHLDIIFPGGQWGSNLKTVAPGQTFKLDVREVRDSQAKGSEGNTIPLDATRGHVYWSAFGTSEKVLIGRAQTVDLDHGMASTYECQVCACPSSFANARMTPSSVIGYPGYSGLLQAEQQNRSCNGTLSSWFAPGGVNFSSANPSVATIDSGGFMTAIAPGSTTLYGSWTGTVHYSAGPSGCQTTYVNANPGASCNVEPPCAYPVNFRQTSVTELPNGVLQFQYAWDSNTGNIADLSNCVVGEIVTYPGGDPFIWPSPPYASDSGNDNPEIREVNGNLGGSPDTHGHKLFQIPYTFNTFTATQYYRYKCPCKDGGAYVNLMGPIEVIRTVQFVPFPAWTYQIKKSGSLAHVTLP